jgi:antitoxin (DNA-binding transcriptional repressor) of toxin-antitoxin stability system
VVSITGDTVRVTTLGRPYARLVAAAFDTFRATSPGLFSRAV